VATSGRSTTGYSGSGRGSMIVFITIVDVPGGSLNRPDFIGGLVR
jgi:hypothetical protein